MLKTAVFALLLAGLSSSAFAGSTMTSAPEVDSGLFAGALVVIGGGALLIRSRLRR